jgi:acid phosphatase type 7
MRISLLTILLAGILVVSVTEKSASQVGNTTKQSASGSINYLDSLRKVATSKSEENFDVPGFTKLRKAIVSSNTGADADKTKTLEEALKNLRPKETPYSIVVNINQDPSSQMAFNWFTNAGVKGGKVQIIKGIVSSREKFAKPMKTVDAKTFPANDLNYSVKSNGLSTLAGIVDNSKRSYTVNKAIVTNLKPNTDYSFRVGSEGHWSNVGTFKTAPSNKSDFSFLYTTDPQANNDEMFNISQRTTHTARSMYPGVSFWLTCGDLVQSDKSANSEWEWEQFFLTQQDLFLHIPFAPIIGNHDKSVNKNFTSHFNTSSTDFDVAMSTSPGSVYSFVYGNALFLALSFEDYDKPGYLESLAKWMKGQVSEHAGVKWKIAYYHKTLFTGSHSHQDDSDGKLIRDRFAPLFDSLKIDLALQGHDHIYEVIGPVKGKMLVPGAIKNQLQVPANPRENVTGRLNGVFNVKEGTVYVLNNSAGKKKYEPKTKAEMDSSESKLGIKNYFGLFSGRFGQTGRPTFSNISVTRDTITVSTFEVYDEGNASLFDKIKLVK